MKRLIILALVIITFSSCDHSSSPVIKKPREVTLKATVEKSQTQLVITNNDSFTWLDVNITINKEYKYRVDSIIPYSVQKIGLMNFANSDNKLLDPFQFKIKDITFYCEIPGGNNGYCSATFR